MTDTTGGPFADYVVETVSTVPQGKPYLTLWHSVCAAAGRPLVWEGDTAIPLPALIKAAAYHSATCKTGTREATFLGGLPEDRHAVVDGPDGPGTRIIQLDSTGE